MRPARLSLPLLVVIGAAMVGCSQPIPHTTFTARDARSLSTPALAQKVLGPLLGVRVIEAIRHERGEGPETVEFYTQPEVPIEGINRVCSVDYILIHYNWLDIPEIKPSTPLRVKSMHVETRYKGIIDPSGEPGSDAYKAAHAAACAKFKTGLDAFRAPSAGDAQWLAAMEPQYLQGMRTPSGWALQCNDDGRGACRNARRLLTRMPLRNATQVEAAECSPVQTGYQVRYCYRLTFQYPDEFDHPEWQVFLEGGMLTGSSPVELMSVKMQHVPRPIRLH